MALWNRTSFRPGQAGDYDALNVTEPESPVQRERAGSGEQDDGRGDAILDGAPKPVPGDELYDTLHQERSEQIDRATYARQDDGHANTTATEFAAMIALTSRPSRQESDQAPEIQASLGQEQAHQPQEPEQQDGRGSPYAMRAEQAATDIEPQPAPQEPERQNGLMADFVTAETQATHDAEMAQAQQQQRSRTMGLSM